jgi:hypothetical protein
MAAFDEIFVRFAESAHRLCLALRADLAMALCRMLSVSFRRHFIIDEAELSRRYPPAACRKRESRHTVYEHLEK